MIVLAGASVSLLPLGVHISHADLVTDWLTNGGAANAAVQAQQVVDPGTGCSLFSFDGGKCFEFLTANAVQIIVEGIGWILTLSGWVLNYSINATIVNMSQNLKDFAGIQSGWRAIRDLGNMIFIFLLLYEAILTVIGRGHYQKTIRNVVIAALLVNFSLFFTQVAIDASNIVTIGFYTSIQQSSLAAGAPTTDPTSFGFSNAFMAPLGLSSFFQATDAAKNLAQSGTMAIILNGLLASILILIASVIFLAMALMLVIRFIVLVFLMMLSPLAVLGIVMPQVGSMSRRWLNTLNGQLLFAPVFMILSWLTLRVISNSPIANTISGKSFTDLAGGGTGALNSTSLLFNYAVIIGFMVFSLVASKNLATRGGGMIANAMNKGSQWAGGAVFGSAGYGLRRSVGKLGQATVDSKWANRLKTTPMLGGAVGWTSRRAFKQVDEKVAKNSFDLRNTGIGKGLGTGSGQKGGFRQWKKGRDDEKRETGEIKKKLETQADIKAGTQAFDARQKLLEEQEKLNATLATATVGTPAHAAATTRLAAIKTEIGNHENTENKARKTIQGLNDKQLEGLGKSLEHEFVAQSLSPQKLNSTMRAEKHDDERKEKVKQARYKPVYEHVKALDDFNSRTAGRALTPAEIDEKEKLEKNAKEAISRLSVQDMEYIDPTHFRNENFAMHVQQGVFEGVTKPEHAALTNTEKTQLAEARLAPVIRALSNPAIPGIKNPNSNYNANDAYDAIFKLDGKAAAKLDLNLLTNPDALEAFDAKKLGDMAKSMDRTKRLAFKNAFNANAAPFIPPAVPTGTHKELEKLVAWLNTGKGKKMYS
ncbi:MAG TPA: hypothetical protein VHF05_01735 [Candidatus Paceibacterota bacterium]|nr:hypothetical protein [Candidatus Paceibacterota bacterium]